MIHLSTVNCEKSDLISVFKKASQVQIMRSAVPFLVLFHGQWIWRGELEGEGEGVEFEEGGMVGKGRGGLWRVVGVKLRRGEMVKDRLASQQTVPEQTSILFERCRWEQETCWKHFFVTCISFLKIWDSLSEPEASQSQKKRNNSNYCQLSCQLSCQLGLTCGCLLIHSWGALLTF